MTYCPKNELFIATWNGNCDLVEALIVFGFDVDETDSEGKTPLMIATSLGNKELVQLLIDFKTDINLPSKNGCTPLIYAVLAGEKEIVELLLKNGADTGIKNDVNGYNALELAIIYNLYDIAQLIIKHGGKVREEYVKGMLFLMDKEMRNEYNELIEAS